MTEWIRENIETLTKQGKTKTEWGERKKEMEDRNKKRWQRERRREDRKKKIERRREDSQKKRGGGHTGLANKTVFKQRRHIQSTKYGVIIKILLNFNKNWLMFREITKISSKNFAKSRKFRPNFDFVFRENFAKLEENFAKHEIKISRNFREITKTKIFVTTLSVCS